MLCNLFDGYFFKCLHHFWHASYIFVSFIHVLHCQNFMRCIMCTLLAKIRLFIFSPMYFSCSKMFFVGSHAYDVWFDNLCRFLQ